MEDANTLVYTMRDLNQNTARVITEIRAAGKPAFITSYGRFIAIITPLEPGQVEQQTLTAIARSIDVTGTANREIAGELRETRQEEGQQQ